mgnify:CR=1 FL=1
MTRDVHPRLETPRLLLRPMRTSDLDALLLIFTDPAVMAAFGIPPLTHEQMSRWVDHNLTHQAEHGYGLFAVLLKESGELIGDCGLQQMSIDGATEVELGYDFRSDHWNRGFATEAARSARDYAFEALDLPRIVSLIRAGNHASRRVAEKIGMSLQREIERYEQPYWIFAMTRPER